MQNLSKRYQSHCTLAETPASVLCDLDRSMSHGRNNKLANSTVPVILCENTIKFIPVSNRPSLNPLSAAT